MNDLAPGVACASMGSLGSARGFLAREQWREGWGAALAAIRVRPFHPEAYLLLAEIAHRVGDSGSARHCAQVACDYAPGWAAPREFLQGPLVGATQHDWLTLPPGAAAGLSGHQEALTLCLIVRNEEGFLGRCLASAQKLARQIVVVDTGSVDRTVGIARDFGAEVHFFEWVDDFSAARNFALEHARGDWVLVLDADEELMAEAGEALAGMLREPRVVAWRLPLEEAGERERGPSYVPRMFRNAPGLYYVGRVHEQVFGSLEPLRRRWGLESRLGTARILHHGYTREVTSDRNKIERNLRLLERAVRERPGDANLLMNLGLERVRSGRLEEGLEAYRAAVAAVRDLPESEVMPEFRESLLTQVGTHLLAARLYEELVAVLGSPLARSQGGLSASMYYLRALARIELRDRTGAADDLREVLARRDRPALAPVHSEIHGVAPWHCLAMCLHSTGDRVGAEEAFRRALEADPRPASVLMDYIRFLASNGRGVEGLRHCHELVVAHPGEVGAWILGGELALGAPEFLEVAMDWTAAACELHAADARVRLQRAEAVLLSGNPAEALVWVAGVGGADLSARGVAMRVLCELTAGEGALATVVADPDQTTREFARWYLRLSEFGAGGLLDRVHARVAVLREVLPAAWQALEQSSRA